MQQNAMRAPKKACDKAWETWLTLLTSLLFGEAGIHFP